MENESNQPDTIASPITSTEAEAIATALPAACPSCGSAIQVSDARFCAECGFDLSQTAPAPTQITELENLATVLLADEPAVPNADAATAALAVPLLRFVAAGITDKGEQRDYNQDDYAICMAEVGRAGRPLPQVFVVADGMGGTVGGEIASAIARARIVDWAATQLQDVVSNATTELRTPGEMLAEQVKAISEEIHQRAEREGTDMGSTLTGAVVVGSTAYVVNVGDSRTYHIRAGAMTRISKDHSLVERLIDAGAMNAEERYTHPQRNIILRALGDGGGVPVDVFECALERNDMLLVCSDGLWEMVRDARLCEIVSAASSPWEASQKLVQEANANGGEDNITAIVVWAI